MYHSFSLPCLVVRASLGLKSRLLTAFRVSIQWVTAGWKKNGLIQGLSILRPWKGLWLQHSIQQSSRVHGDLIRRERKSSQDVEEGLLHLFIFSITWQRTSSSWTNPHRPCFESVYFVLADAQKQRPERRALQSSPDILGSVNLEKYLAVTILTPSMEQNDGRGAERQSGETNGKFQRNHCVRVELWRGAEA